MNIFLDKNMYKNCISSKSKVCIIKKDGKQKS